MADADRGRRLNVMPKISRVGDVRSGDGGADYHFKAVAGTIDEESPGGRRERYEAIDHGPSEREANTEVMETTTTITERVRASGALKDSEIENKTGKYPQRSEVCRRA